MKKFITLQEFDTLSNKEKNMYEIIYLDPETKCIPYGYILLI